jgi:hypothetical protein
MVIPSLLVPYTSQEDFPLGSDGKITRRTPAGLVQVYWHVDQGTEDGQGIAHPDELHQYATVTHFAIISPPRLPVIAEVELPETPQGGRGWVHVNGHRLTYYPSGGTDKRRPFCKLVVLRGGLNIVQAGLYDAE